MAQKLIAHTPISTHEFDQLAAQPANASRRYERIEGVVMEVAFDHTIDRISRQLGGLLAAFVFVNDLGLVTRGDSGFQVGRERYVPALAFVGKHRQPRFTPSVYYPFAPDLAIEILQPGDDLQALYTKILNYLQAGTHVWVMDAARRQVECYAPAQEPYALGLGEVLEGGALLPGFKLAVNAIFTGRE